MTKVVAVSYPITKAWFIHRQKGFMDGTGDKQLRRNDGSNGSLFQGARAEYHTPKQSRGNDFIFSVVEGATSNYRQVYNKYITIKTN